ncbi:MAG: type II toxin-antitoxin system ParD family antitoxin [Alphaproteobacteria bacterium]|nr:type II toxin-antitoxin system ParD family antitoxin [Alphaproteobacteria bacterium]
MTAKTSISLTDAQEAYARELVARGRYPSLSAVLQHGLELLRAEKEAEDAEIAALRALLQDRRRGPFIGVNEGRKRTERMIAARKKGDAV